MRLDPVIQIRYNRHGQTGIGAPGPAHNKDWKSVRLAYSFL